MLDKNKIIYKLKFDINLCNPITKIFNFRSKEFESITYVNSDFITIMVKEDYIFISNYLPKSNEIGFNVLREIINNPSNIIFNFEYTYCANKILDDNKVFVLNKNPIKKES